MTIKWYRCSANPKKVNKAGALQLLGTSTIQPRDDFDLREPVVVLTYTASLLNVNYAEIAGRYYFVEEPSLDTGGRMTFRCRPDLLMINRAEILNLEAILARSSDVFNSYIADGQTVHQSNDETINYSLGTLGTGYGASLVFAAIGGRGT